MGSVFVPFAKIQELRCQLLRDILHLVTHHDESITLLSAEKIQPFVSMGNAEAFWQLMLELLQYNAVHQYTFIDIPFLQQIERAFKSLEMGQEVEAQTTNYIKRKVSELNQLYPQAHYQSSPDLQSDQVASPLIVTINETDSAIDIVDEVDINKAPSYKDDSKHLSHTVLNCALLPLDTQGFSYCERLLAQLIETITELDELYESHQLQKNYFTAPYVFVAEFQQWLQRSNIEFFRWYQNELAVFYESTDPLNEKQLLRFVKTIMLTRALLESIICGLPVLPQTTDQEQASGLLAIFNTHLAKLTLIEGLIELSKELRQSFEKGEISKKQLKLIQSFKALLPAIEQQKGAVIAALLNQLERDKKPEILEAVVAEAVAYRQLIEQQLKQPETYYAASSYYSEAHTKLSSQPQSAVDSFKGDFIEEDISANLLAEFIDEKPDVLSQDRQMMLDQPVIAATQALPLQAKEKPLNVADDHSVVAEAPVINTLTAYEEDELLTEIDALLLENGLAPIYHKTATDKIVVQEQKSEPLTENSDELLKQQYLYDTCYRFEGHKSIQLSNPPQFDEELIEELVTVFKEEAQTILQLVDTQLTHLRFHMDDVAALMELRRGFHTLKGSGRMAGMMVVGEIAWLVESILNGCRDGLYEFTPAIFQHAVDGRIAIKSALAGQNMISEMERLAYQAEKLVECLGVVDISVMSASLSSDEVLESVHDLLEADAQVTLMPEETENTISLNEHLSSVEPIVDIKDTVLSATAPYFSEAMMPQEAVTSQEQNSESKIMLDLEQILISDEQNVAIDNNALDNSAFNEAALLESALEKNMPVQTVMVSEQADTTDQLALATVQHPSIETASVVEIPINIQSFKSRLQSTSQSWSEYFSTAPSDIQDSSGLDTDLLDELAEIFSLEATEALEEIDRCQKLLVSSLSNQDITLELRRHFHTLKGSGRMVGRNILGEFAWCAENLLNACRDGLIPFTKDGLIFTVLAAAAIQRCVEANNQEYLDRQLLAYVIEDGEYLLSHEGTFSHTAFTRFIATDTHPTAIFTADVVDHHPDMSVPEQLPAINLTDEITSEQVITNESLPVMSIDEDLEASLSAILKNEQSAQSSAPISSSVPSESVAFLSKNIVLNDSGASTDFEQLLSTSDLLLGEMNVALEEPNIQLLKQTFERCRSGAPRAMREYARLIDNLKDYFRYKQFSEQDQTLINSYYYHLMSYRAHGLTPTEEVFDCWQQALSRFIELLDPQSLSSLIDIEALITRFKQPILGQETVTDSNKTVAAPSDDVDVDEDLYEAFLDESREVLAHTDELLIQWADSGYDANSRYLPELRRQMHTIKGGARMVGRNDIGYLTHALESLLEPQQIQRFGRDPRNFETLQRAMDHIGIMLEFRRKTIDKEGQNLLSALYVLLGHQTPPDFELTANEVSIEDTQQTETTQKTNIAAQSELGALRIDPNQLKEITSGVAETSMLTNQLITYTQNIQFGLEEIETTVMRLRSQGRRIEIETEAQIVFRNARASETAEEFDPLELDRFSELQQLSRTLLEAVEDIASVKQVLINVVDGLRTTLEKQRNLQDGVVQQLTDVRAMSFATIVPRLRRLVRQVAKEQGKKVDIEVIGTEVQVERTILEQMVAPLEHMLRNSVFHGIESPERRVELNKPERGKITIRLTRESSQLQLLIADDGKGLDFKKLHESAVAKKLIEADQDINEEVLHKVLLMPGFTTVHEVTETAGRGVGLDVLNRALKLLRATLKVESEEHKGVCFTLQIPFTMMVTNVLIVDIVGSRYAIPLVSIVGIGNYDEVRQHESNGEYYMYGGEAYGVRYISGLTSYHQDQAEGSMLLLVKTFNGAFAVRVNRVITSQEVVIRALNPQISEISGISGVIIMPDGQIIFALDLNGLSQNNLLAKTPSAHVMSHAVVAETQEAQLHTIGARPELISPLIMVVDDSITMRKVSTRMLERAGFRVETAKDGVEALEKLADSKPDLMMLDIEMPRMDGFEVLTQIREDENFHALPVIMVTSRTGDKHRQRALSLGVNEYCGKPYQESHILSIINQLLGLEKQDSMHDSIN